MAMPPTATAGPRVDDLDTTDVWKTFKRTLLGQLPTELLQIITEYLGQRDLPAVARIHPILRALADRRLYCPYVSIPYFPDEGEACGRGEELWPFCRTLSHREDLADTVQAMYLVLQGRDLSIEIPAVDLLPGHMPFTSTISTTMEEACIVGMPLPRLANLKDLDMHMVRHVPRNKKIPDDDTSLVRGTLSRLFPGYGSLTVHLVSPPLLPRLECLYWNCDDFLWALAKSPKLKSLNLARPYKFLPDAAPHELNPTVEHFTMAAKSSILNSNAGQVEPLRKFIAHFPALKFIYLTVHDTDYDDHVTQWGRLSPQGRGSFAEVVRLLQPVTSSLRTLVLGPVSSKNDSFLQYLRHADPCAGFQEFRVLEELCAPYQCLFAPSSQWSHITPSPSQLLPATLTWLHIDHPRIEVYDWLARIPHFRDELPVLVKVILQCSQEYGDSYEVFAYISYPHPVLAALKSIDVTLRVDNHDEWDDAWLEYNLKALDCLLSFNAFGPSRSGETIILIIDDLCA
jgi:hypothetical protein